MDIMAEEKNTAKKTEEEEQMQGYVKRSPVKRKPVEDASTAKPGNKVLKLLEKNPLGMTLPEMAGGTRKPKQIRTLRPMLSEAIKQGLVMPVSQRSGHTVYRLVKHISNR